MIRERVRIGNEGTLLWGKKAIMHELSKMLGCEVSRATVYNWAHLEKNPMPVYYSQKPRVTYAYLEALHAWITTFAPLSRK